jgi:hypothetical protein
LPRKTKEINDKFGQESASSSTFKAVTYSTQVYGVIQAKNNMLLKYVQPFPIHLASNLTLTSYKLTYSNGQNTLTQQSNNIKTTDNVKER